MSPSIDAGGGGEGGVLYSPATIPISNIHGSTNGSTATTASATSAAGFNMNDHDYDGLLKGSSLSSEGDVTDRNDFVSGESASAGGVGKGAGGAGSDAGGGANGGGGASGGASGGANGGSGAVALPNTIAADNTLIGNTTGSKTNTGPAGPSSGRGGGGRGGGAVNGTTGRGQGAVSGSGSGPDGRLARKSTATMAMMSLGAPGVSELKLRRFLEHNQRLRDQLEMQRATVSEASRSLIQYVTSTRDPLLPIIWGTIGPDPFAKQTNGCCIIC